MAIYVYTWADLNNVRNNLNEDVILMNNLDENTEGYDTYASSNANDGAGWLPIGTYSSSFTGTFNGNGYKIKGLYINSPSTDYVGIFGKVYWAYDGKFIKNLTIENFNITGRNNVGCLIGYWDYGDDINLLIDNITLNNVVCNGGQLYLKGGGLIGEICQKGGIRETYKITNIKGYINSISGGGYIGGVVGYGGSAYMENVDIQVGTISGSSCVGGVLGEGADMVVKKSRIEILNKVEATHTAGGSAGGFCGRQGFFYECYVYGNGKVVGNKRVGGFIVQGGSCYNCFSRVRVEGYDEVGGFQAADSNAYNCYSTGQVSGTSRVGGFSGSGGASVKYCYWDKETSGQNTSADGIGLTTSEMKTISSYRTYISKSGVLNIWCDWENPEMPFYAAYVSGDNYSGILAGDSILYKNWMEEWVSFDVDEVISDTRLKISSWWDEGQFEYNCELGWNFTNIWSMSSSVNDGYPYLRALQQETQTTRRRTLPFFVFCR